MSAVAIALSALGLLGDVTTRYGLYGRAETAVGIAPLAPFTPAEKAFAATLDVVPRLVLESPRSTFTLEAGPRVYYRQPNLSGTERPLVLGHGGLSHSYALDRVTTWRTTANAAIGEVEYASTQLAITPGTGTQLRQPVLQVFRASGTTGLDWRVERNEQMSIAAVAEHAESLGSQLALLPTTTTVGGDAQWRWLQSRRTAFGFPVQVRYYFVYPGLDQMTGAVGALWTEQLDSHTTLDLGAGIARVIIFNQDASSFYPRAAASLRQKLLTRSGGHVQNEYRAGLDAIFDVTRGEVIPVASVQVTTNASWRNVWGARFGISGYTQLGSIPPPTVAATTVAGELVVDRRLTEVLDLLGGFRYMARASHFYAEELRIIDRQGWIFVGLALALESRVSRRTAPSP